MRIGLFWLIYCTSGGIQVCLMESLECSFWVACVGILYCIVGLGSWIYGVQYGWMDGYGDVNGYMDMDMDMDTDMDTISSYCTYLVKQKRVRNTRDGWMDEWMALCRH